MALWKENLGHIKSFEASCWNSSKACRRIKFEKTEKNIRLWQCALCKALLDEDRPTCTTCRTITERAIKNIMSTYLYEIVIVETVKDADPKILSGSSPMLLYAEDKESAQRIAIVKLTKENQISEENSGELKVYCRPFVG